MIQDDKRKRSIDFSIKAAWLSISKKYNALGADYDISHSTGFVLLNIDREHGTPATKIAPLMGMEARSLTRMLKTMEEKGIIERIPDSEDKRKVIIKLTEYGQLKRELARQSVKALQRKVDNLLTEEEQNFFFSTMEKINEAVDILEEDVPIDLIKARDAIHQANQELKIKNMKPKKGN